MTRPRRSPKPLLLLFLLAGLSLACLFPGAARSTEVVVIVPAAARLERLADDERALRRDPSEDRAVWIRFLADLRKKADWRLEAARDRARWEWVYDPILDDPASVRRAARAEWRRWRARYLAAFSSPDGLYCLEAQHLGESWWAGAKPLTAEAILDAPMPDHPDEALCRALRLPDAPDPDGETTTARAYARRYRDADPDDPARHRPLVDLLGADDAETLDARRRWAAAAPDDFEARRALLAAHRGDLRQEPLERSIETLWPEATTRQRFELCELHRQSGAAYTESMLRSLDCRMRAFDDADPDDPPPYELYEDIAFWLALQDETGEALAWLDRMPADRQLALWRRALEMLPRSFCGPFLLRWDAGSIGLPSGRLVDGSHPAVAADRGLERCEAEERRAAWLERVAELWGPQVVTRLVVYRDPDLYGLEDWIREGLLAFREGDLVTTEAVAGEVLEDPESSPRQRAEARYLLGRAAMERDDAVGAVDHLEAYFLARLRFTGCHELRRCDQPFRHLLRGVSRSRLARYIRLSQWAEQDYLDTLAPPRYARRGIRATRVPWPGLPAIPFDDVELLESADYVAY